LIVHRALCERESRAAEVLRTKTESKMFMPSGHSIEGGCTMMPTGGDQGPPSVPPFDPRGRCCRPSRRAIKTPAPSASGPSDKPPLMTVNITRALAEAITYCDTSISQDPSGSSHPTDGDASTYMIRNHHLPLAALPLASRGHHDRPVPTEASEHPASLLAFLVQGAWPKGL
jgi:hypothetical protein